MSSCKQNLGDEESIVSSEKEIMEALVEVNKSVVKRNRNHIQNFIKRTAWKMDETDDGIWFGIVEHGIGEKVSINDEIRYSWHLRFIDGTNATNSQEPKINNILLGQGGVESGLEKGLMLMSEGDSAIIIVPPYLAHGNFGETGKIPPGAILIFDIKLLNISRSATE